MNRNLNLRVKSKNNIATECHITWKGAGISEDIGSIITKQALRVKMELVGVIIEVVISSRRMGVPNPSRLDFRGGESGAMTV